MLEHLLPLLLPFRPSFPPIVAAGGAGLLLAAGAAGAQPAAPVDSTLPASPVRPIPAPTSDRWARVTLAGEWAHLGAGPVVRPDVPYTAVRSLTGTASFPLGPAERPGVRLDAGFLRAVRSANTSQGVTLGASLPIGVPTTGGRLHVYPGVAAAAGWAERETVGGTYAWRGLPGTPEAGQTGTTRFGAAERSRMTGLGAHLAAELGLDGWLGRESQGIALAGSVRRWAFRGRATAPHRRVTLVGVGLAVRPSAFVYKGVYTGGAR